MQIMTFRARPKTLFGIILAITGILVIIITFVSNHGAGTVDAPAYISCSTGEERANYLTSLGWEFEDEQSKEITIPETFNKVYEDYNRIQKKQGFDLENYKGKSAVLYTYKIKNYKDNNRIIADLLVCDGVLIGADLCDPSAENGFLEALRNNNGTA